MAKEIYRSCASIAVFRLSESASTFEILLVHKPRKNDAWQLPQGGCEEGESMQETAAREVLEEAGITPKIIDTSSVVYQYDFPKSFRKFRPDNVKGQRIEYVFAIADPNQTVQVDGEEINQYAWVLPAQFSRYIKRREYLQIVQRVYEEGIELLQKSKTRNQKSKLS